MKDVSGGRHGRVMETALTDWSSAEWTKLSESLDDSV